MNKHKYPEYAVPYPKEGMFKADVVFDGVKVEEMVHPHLIDQLHEENFKSVRLSTYESLWKMVSMEKPIFDSKPESIIIVVRPSPEHGMDSGNVEMISVGDVDFKIAVSVVFRRTDKSDEWKGYYLYICDKVYYATEWKTQSELEREKRTNTDE